MRTVSILSVLVLLLMAACQAATSTLHEPTVSPAPAEPPEPEMQTAKYAPIEGDVLNPERGFRYSLEYLDPNADYSLYRTLGTSLVFSYIRLDDYREKDLPPELLQQTDAGFAALRKGGVKIVLRFAYNFGPYPNSEPDASLEWILRHIGQLKPVLQKNADVIAWLHAGFIGAWGEWHTSTHGLDRDMKAKRAVLEALADALPPDRFILLRYPPDLMTLFPEPLTAEQAFKGTLQARLGFHNDCLLSSATDVGTYGGPVSREQAIRYLSQITQFTPASGETCQVYPELQTCDRAIKELETLHWTDLNISYHKQVIRNWQRAGCFEEIQRRLGYRLVLEEATWSAWTRPGGTLRLSWKLRNEGFAAPLNPRPLFVALHGPTTVTLPIESVDPRTWLPGRWEESAEISLPADLPAGEYRLALWLPDGYESLRSDPRHSIRFANEGIWDEERGWNVLGTVRVQP